VWGSLRLLLWPLFVVIVVDAARHFKQKRKFLSKIKKQAKIACQFKKL
jgi:hypothetical protein